MKNLLFGLLLVSALQAQSSYVKMKEVWVLGRDLNAQSEYLFSKPDLLEVDSKGNVYVVDKNHSEILKYDSGGRYIRKYGRLGSGPEEFKSITQMSMKSNDEIVVFDIMNNRYAIIDTKKEKNNIKTYMCRNSEKPMFAAQSGNEDFVIADFAAVSNRKTMFTVMNKDFSRKKESFCELSSILDFNDKVQSIATIEFVFTGINRNKLAFVYKLDESISYIAEQKGGKWLINKFVWNEKRIKPYVEISDSEMHDKDDNAFKVGYGGANGYVNFKEWRKTLGIAAYLNKNIIIFVAKKDSKDNETLEAELFTLSGQYLSTSILMKEKKQKYSLLNGKVYKCDKEGNVYFMHYENNVPVIKKCKLDL